MDTHDLAFAGEPDQRNQGKRYAEAKQDLAQDQSERGFDAGCQDGQGRDQGDDPAGQERHANLQQSAHDGRTGVAAYGGGGQA
ncbi:hypothetical protein D9M72_639110 [compost metagenome]